MNVDNLVHLPYSYFVFQFGRSVSCFHFKNGLFLIWGIILFVVASPVSSFFVTVPVAYYISGFMIKCGACCSASLWCDGFYMVDYFDDVILNTQYRINQWEFRDT
jgi:hypothetical protein